MAINLTHQRTYAQTDSLVVQRPADDPNGGGTFCYSRDSEIAIWSVLDGVPTIVTYDWGADQWVPYVAPE